jgi:hypothetical protein
MFTKIPKHVAKVNSITTITDITTKRNCDSIVGIASYVEGLTARRAFI